MTMNNSNNRSLLLRISSLAMLMLSTAIMMVDSVNGDRPHTGAGFATSEPVQCGNDDSRTLDVYCEWEFNESEEDVECIIEFCDGTGPRRVCDDEDDITLTTTNHIGRNNNIEWTYDYDLDGPSDIVSSVSLDFEFDFIAEETLEADGTYSLAVTMKLDCKEATAPVANVNPGSSVRSVTGCENSIPGWSDKDGDPCEWYEENDDPGCPVHGNKWIPFNGPFKGISAKDACCYCNPNPGPRTAPEKCQDEVDWTDRDGDDCGWYELGDRPGCPLHGNFGAQSGGTTANEACCYCKRGKP